MTAQEIAEIIKRVVGKYNQPGKAYPQPLPADLAPWYCYTVDGGYSILVVPQVFATNTPVEDYLVPLPVKFVQQGYLIRSDGFIQVDVPYDQALGAVVPDGFEEF